jgi:FHA domain
MSWFETFLTHLEARLRLMIEGDGNRDGFPRKLHHQLTRELIRVMKANVHQCGNPGLTAESHLAAPDHYTLVLPAVEAQILLNHPTELDRLVRILEKTALRAGIQFIAAPILQVVADPQGASVTIQTGFDQPELRDSSTFRLDGNPCGSGHDHSEKFPNAYLIVNGLVTFSITLPVINIGRDPSNQLQLDDPQISRQHAQLRFVQGHFIIFDLDSSGGTFVNGVAVSSHLLTPGDVIRLSALPLVYGQESTIPGGQTQELPIAPPPPEVL